MSEFAPDPWERQTREQGRAFAAFQVYRDLPAMDRSLRKAAVMLERPLRDIERWSRLNRWIERARAWDDEQDRLLRAESIKARIDFQKRLAAAGALLQVKGLARIRQFVEPLDRDGQPVELRIGQSYINELAPGDATRLIEVGARLEALGRGVDEDLPVLQVTMTANPILAALTRDPTAIGGASDAIRRLASALGLEEQDEPLLIEKESAGSG